ncbi:MAG: DNA-directed RNA polymerase subunit omega [Chlorobi bacterium]|nr:DNA-directed RNA polymerase subunit omega [Chlorobiota bacterium]
MTDFFNSKAPVTTVTINRDKVAEPTGNIYMAIVIIAKRAEQIQQEMKESFRHDLEQIEQVQEVLQEIYENPDHIEISKKYERLPKPWAIALQEWLEGKIKWRFADDAKNK